MDHYDMEDVVVAPPPELDGSSRLKEWRLKLQAGTLARTDFVDFFRKQSPKFFQCQNESETDTNAPTLKCMFKENLAKEEIIDVLVEFILGDNPTTALEKLRLEGNTATVCGKVFKNGEPTYSCRECGVDPTCVLCVNCFKRSAHRFHKYKMSTSGGGGCCDCGDDEAWKRDQYCEMHLANRKNPLESKVITDTVLERCEICFGAILAFCVNYLEIEPNASLQCLEGEVDGEHFCTVLYNDESHTFDQVIQTLTKIAKCRHKDAMEIVAAIDREGRAVVKCDTFKECNDLKVAIENQMIPLSGLLANSRTSQSLRTSVLHINSIACQQFALQLLTWFQEFLVRHYLFRKTFSTLVQDKNETFCIRHILEYDVKLWKTARTCWHRLLISGMLMEYENKMVLAQEFSRRYATIVEDFISDDHDHSFSVVSLSVQLFTVPSIAHHLIAQEGIFFKLLHTFYHVAIEKFIHNRTLHFSKNIANMAYFKRANYILYDLRYLLSFKPDKLSNDLRNGFLEGCKALMRVLSVMQGMESITRQTGQHMDYEPEWECAFNLHIKLATTISQVIEWAASDAKLLKKLYKKTVRNLVNSTFIVGSEKEEAKTVAGHVANCLMYDVSVRPVSIHLPLSRFYAGIYLHLGNHDMTYDSMAAEDDSFQLTPQEIIEPVLCTQAMIAQVAAGMWRRNGYSLLHQLYFYRNVRCRVEMLDRDIVCLQIGASLMESNEFLIHMLNKFNMVPWALSNYEAVLAEGPIDEEFMRQLSMIDEFLELLIVIIGERWMPGVSLVTEGDRLRKEIIQLLCIKSYSHSELSRSLPDNNGNSDSILEDVINTVAVFKKPASVESKGVYELKEHLYDEFNVYFYHYTKEDKSKAEEMQRERRKAKKQLVCCPPPMLPQLTPAFKSMANILQCNVFLAICTLVMRRAINPHSRSFAESHLQKVLHLLGFAIQEELTEHYPFLTFYERSVQFGILDKLEELLRCQRLESHRDFVLWTIKRYKELQAKQAPLAAADSQEPLQGEEPPLSSEEQARLEKETRARLAAERRAKIMAQMQSARNSFMKSNADMFASEKASSSDGKRTESGNDMDWEEAEEGAIGNTPSKTKSCLGSERTAYQPGENSFKCILCFEDCSITTKGPPLVSSAFLQTSRVIYTPLKDEGKKSALHVSCCGHVMHYNCWQEYYSNEESKEQRRPHRSRMPFGQSPFVEFHCPYCRTLSNTVLPVSEALPQFSPAPAPPANGEQSMLPLDCFLEIMRTLSVELASVLASSMEEDDMLLYGSYPRYSSILRKSNVIGDVTQLERSAQIIPKPAMNENWDEVMSAFIKAQVNTKHLLTGRGTPSVSILWETCSYTLQSLETYLYATNRPLKAEMPMRHQACTINLVRASALFASNLSHGEIREQVEDGAKLLDTLFNQKGPSVLEWDCFPMMVTMNFMIPGLLIAADTNKTIIPSGSMFDFYTLQTCFMANLTKATICFDYSAEAGAQQEEDDPMAEQQHQQPSSKMLQYVKQLPIKIHDNIITFYRKYNLPARIAQHEATERQRTQAESEGKSEVEMERLPNIVIPCELKHIALLFEYVQKQMSAFLRCSCLFYRCMTDIDFPDTFPTEGKDRFDLMCAYLGLEPQLGAYFDMETVYATMLDNFASHPDIVNINFPRDWRPQLKVHPCLPPLPQLVNLYEDYSDLINSVSDICCPNNEREEMKTPTMCLICGKILCGQSYCCQPELGKMTVGACTYHAHSCGSEVGIFLRIRDCQVVYLGRGKGCFVQPPYLDEYGETDQGLRRGNPLRLCKAAYKRIYLQWLGHNLHEEIARLNENANVAVTQWHHI
ncbi:E3 ubiquitin-protein ligase UBR1 isoform X2 [Scaptodrosophila lebanonensis]|uniref:E3 ubiquitin-protein ligase n=1 Tax=Drosophila lebanonensis TaxID=7225 RepID=A0A6J2TQT6_DROLE|nr:E3 ubiquitin-protein ligase UBR1 isoform X2 [Scaptodrosophila lebanonensis]